jgi:hypothetical protein
VVAVEGRDLAATRLVEAGAGGQENVELAVGSEVNGRR